MTRIPVHTVDSAPEGSRDALKVLEAQFGGTLDKRLREVIALAVANVDECSYCQAAHTAGGRAAGLSEQETIDVRRGQVDDPKTAAPVTLVREQAANVGHVQDGTRQAAVDAGWTDTELTETSAVVALNVFTNSFNHLVGTELDLPAAPSL